MVGGLAAQAVAELENTLDAVGFQIRKLQSNLAGEHPQNICNRGRSGQGIQFELSRRLRDKLKADNERRGAFVKAVREVLKGLEQRI